MSARAIARRRCAYSIVAHRHRGRPAAATATRGNVVPQIAAVLRARGASPSASHGGAGRGARARRVRKLTIASELCGVEQPPARVRAERACVEKCAEHLRERRAACRRPSPRCVRRRADRARSSRDTRRRADRRRPPRAAARSTSVTGSSELADVREALEDDARRLRPRAEDEIRAAPRTHADTLHGRALLRRWPRSIHWRSSTTIARRPSRFATRNKISAAPSLKASIASGSCASPGSSSSRASLRETSPTIGARLPTASASSAVVSARGSLDRVAQHASRIRRKVASGASSVVHRITETCARERPNLTLDRVDEARLAAAARASHHDEASAVHASA